MGLTNLVKSMPQDIETKEVLMNISDYEDIFSDFDTKPLTHRSLSDDFLQELKKEGMDSIHEKINLRFVIPDNKRIHRLEIIIKRRIEEYFKKRFRILEQERHRLIRTGILLVVLGVVILTVKYSTEEIFKNWGLEIPHMLLEPISWFLFWEGSYLMFFEARSNKHEYSFYKKISTAKITFTNNDF